MADTLWLCDTAWADMHALADRFCPLETGGMLLGYNGENDAPVITAIVGPGRRAKHGQYRFAPDHEDQLATLDAHFAKTAGRETYLGDWHTHPNGACALSRRDKRVLARIAEAPTSGTCHPIMMIVAGSRDDWRLGAVRFESRKRRLVGHRYDLTVLEPRLYFE